MLCAVELEVSSIMHCFAVLDCDQLDGSLSVSCSNVELSVQCPQLTSRLLGPTSVAANIDVTLSPTHPVLCNCALSCTVLPLQLGWHSVKLLHTASLQLTAIFCPEVNTTCRRQEHALHYILSM